MKLQQIMSATREKASSAVEGIMRFARLERVLAAVCLSIPALLIWFDKGSIRDSISAYYNMKENQIFYYPLTVAAMLFIVNGIVKQRMAYNTILGVMLSGVLLFNHNDAPVLHTIFAVAFFGGNAVVILLFSSKKERWFKGLMVVGILLAMLGFFAFSWFTLFWAEWLSFGIIALHYILESWGVID